MEQFRVEWDSEGDLGLLLEFSWLREPIGWRGLAVIRR